MRSSLKVINANRKKEIFSIAKVYRSARKAGASRKVAEKIAMTIEAEAYPGITTSEIFRRVRELLRQQSSVAAMRFSLKEGMRRMGPTGFPFEKFAAGIFQELGFEVLINQRLPGSCFDDYEVDFLAQKKSFVYVGECKYKNFAGEMVHLQEILANHARFSDILKGPYFKTEKYRNCKVSAIVVTNAKFAGPAVKYSSCAEIDLLGWKYPKNNGLESLIEKYNLYPITILPSLNKQLKEVFVSQGIMLVEDVAKIDPQKFCIKFKISHGQLCRLIEEAKVLLNEKIKEQKDIKI
ncbi:MAG: hypothetical protein ABIF89_02295 [bacterium]